MNPEVRPPVNHNIYRGLYPIKEVKQFYKREFFKGKPLYICLWKDCGFKTWKYSQHIARHIHLKHIGIKELKCDEPYCEKTFKRPESLVQHQKNHLCGFGIDSNKMKDPLNVCGVKNIKKYYFRELDNDYYVFGCKWNGCEFVTNNSGSIRRHVHNQHLCPHSINTNSNNNMGFISDSGIIDDMNRSPNSNNSDYSNNLSVSSNGSEVNLPLIEIIELDSNEFNPNLSNNKQSEESISPRNTDNPFAISAKPIPNVNELETNFNRRSSGGLYSLKNYSELYRKIKIEGEVYFACNCNQFKTKSQISLVRHIWQELGRNVFECDIQGCDAKFDNEFNLYKHRKFDHNYDNSSLTLGKDLQVVESSFSTSISISNSNNNNNNFIDVINDQITDNSINQSQSSPVSITNDLINSSDNTFYSNDSSPNNIIATRIRRSQSGIYSLKNFSRHFRKTRVGDQVYYKCECGNFTTKSSVSLIRHIWVHKGINSFACDLCNAKFDNESSLYRHRKFDHNSRNLPNSMQISCNEPIYANAIQIQPKQDVNVVFNKFCEERKNLLTITESIPSGDTQTTNNSFIPQTNQINCNNPVVNHSKPFNMRKTYAMDRSGSGLYSLKNYSKYYKKLRVNEEFCYKCTVCGFTCKSQVSLIRHIWGHTGMNRFECEDCKINFNSENDLYKHRKLSNCSKNLITTPPNISNSAEVSNNCIINSNNSFNGHKYSFPSTQNMIPITKLDVLPKPIEIKDSFSLIAKTSSVQNQMRKCNAMVNSRPGLYSLKTYESYFNKAKVSDGFNYLCKCGQFQTRSQVSLVRHIWAHQSAENINNNNKINYLNESLDMQKYKNQTNGEVIQSNGEIEMNFNNEREAQTVSDALPTDSLPSRRNLTFKKYKFPHLSPPVLQSAVEPENQSDLYFNELIVRIEDRGYFCQWPECEFSSDIRDEVVMHIRGNHMTGASDECDDYMQTPDNYDEEMEFYNKNNGNVSDFLMITTEESETCEQSSSQTEYFGLNNLEVLIDKQYKNSTLTYLCKAVNCFFETALKPSIINHIQQNHIINPSFNRNSTIHNIPDERTVRNLKTYKCHYTYCNASFPSYEYLMEHQKIHNEELLNNGKQLSSDAIIEPILPNGFGFKYEISKSKGYSYNGDISVQNADKFSETVMERDGNAISVCKWSNCGYKSHVRGNMGDKPFLCEVNNCGQRFAYSTDVKIHQTRYH